MQKRPGSSNGFCSQNQEPIPIQRTGLKKVKVLCTKEQMGIPQPLLTSNNSTKNMNVIKAIQQINSMFASNSNQISQLSQMTIQSNPQVAAQQYSLKSSQSTKHLQQTLKITEVKTPKTGLNIMNVPLTGTNKAQNLKFKQLSQRASGVLMQRCESQQSLGQNNFKQFQQQQQQNKEASLSPISKNNVQKGIKHTRQGSQANFNASQKVQQKSLSPNSDQYQNYHKQPNGKQNTERVRSQEHDSLEAIQRAIANGSYEFDPLPLEKRMTQLIRISPQKQFIVQSCTQQTSPRNQHKKNAIKLQNNNNRDKNNLILEQEDYLLPSQDEIQNYSINHDIQTQIHHDYKMKHQMKKHKESEESINKGFITDRPGSSQLKNELNDNINSHIDTRKKKTKGISYTRNAQELKKLLLESGVLGGISYVGQSSLATAAAGMVSQLDTHIRSDTHATTKGDVFCLSARAKSNKQFTVGLKEKGSCLLQKKQHIKVQQQQLENSVQTQRQGSNMLYQTLDKHGLQFPLSTMNNQIKEFILQDDEELVQHPSQIDSDQVIYRRYSPSKQQESFLRKSPSQIMDHSQNMNFPFQETEQFFSKHMRKNYNSVVGAELGNTAQQRTLTRCFTAAEDIENFPINDVISTNSRQTDMQRRVSDNKSPKGQTFLTTVKQPSKQKAIPGFPLTTNQNLNNIVQSSNQKNIVQEFQKPVKPFFTSSLHQNNENISHNIPFQNIQVDNNKELEIIKFKMIAFVKTYENEFRKMQLQMNDLRQENKQLKKQLNINQKRRQSAQCQNPSYSSIAISKGFSNQGPMCMTSTHNSQIHM